MDPGKVALAVTAATAIASGIALVAGASGEMTSTVALMTTAAAIAWPALERAKAGSRPAWVVAAALLGVAIGIFMLLVSVVLLQGAGPVVLVLAPGLLAGPFFTGDGPGYWPTVVALQCLLYVGPVYVAGRGMLDRWAARMVAGDSTGRAIRE